MKKTSHGSDQSLMNISLSVFKCFALLKDYKTQIGEVVFS